jgi:hypothetical protein
LPIHPSTIEELALIRFWLLKLSQSNFEKLMANANYGILNPKFLSVLNSRTGPRKILVRANHVDLYESDESDAAIPADFTQFICAGRLFLHTFIDMTHRAASMSRIFKFIMDTEKVEKVIIKFYLSEFCEFLVEVKLWKFIFILSKFEI